MSKSKTQTENREMMLRLWLFVSIIFMLTLALIVVWMNLPSVRPEPTSPTTTPSMPVATSTPTPEPEPEPEPQPGPEPTTPVRERPSGFICDDRNFICVDEKVANTLLSSPFIVTGSGIAFENTINWRLLDANGGVLEEGHVTANAPDIGQAGDFEIRAFILHVPTTDTGTLEVLEYSAKDGSPTHVVRIPVRLPRQTMTTRFYMPTGTGTDCTDVAPVELAVVRSALPVETSLQTLLEFGPTISSRRSAIPPGTELRSIVVGRGTATTTFSPELQNYGGGSCNVQAIRAQIETTLKQFSSVRNVVILVEGLPPEEVLQP